MRPFLIALLVVWLCSGISEAHGDRFSSLLLDLEIARSCTERFEQSLTRSYNTLLSTGYFVTPSARMAPQGELAFGGGNASPYWLVNGRAQLFSHLELTANWRFFRGVSDPVLTPLGHGDLADRGANFKVALVTPEQSCNRLPGIAFGIEDFMGSKRFTNYFGVLTQVLYPLGLEMSVGWGSGRYSEGGSLGFFGGAAWFPFFHRSWPLLRPFSLQAEWDPIDYKNPEKEPHPDGRNSSFPINFGLKYSVSFLDFSLYRLRGEEWAWSGAALIDLSPARGLIPKIRDPLPFSGPEDHLPLGCQRPLETWIEELSPLFYQQGFLLTRVWRGGSNRLTLMLVNRCWRGEWIVRQQLIALLMHRVPDNVDEVVCILSSYGLPCQEYLFSADLLRRARSRCLGEMELDLLTQRKGVRRPCGDLAYKRPCQIGRLQFSPRYETFLGAASGKFKYDAGLLASFEGILPWQILYKVALSVTVASSIGDIGDFDLHHPSQLPNVLTDAVRYRQEGSFHVDSAFFQKNWNLGRGLFAKGALGYFQVNFAGLGGELLYYPPRSLFACGAEGAIVKKRSYQGLGFQSELRQLKGLVPTFRSYTTLQQWFFTLFCDLPSIQVAGKMSLGRFLAGDHGVRLEATRYFASGLRLSGWFTISDAKDQLHGVSYYNRGIALEIPLDLFYRCSSRRVWNYALGAWLRDAGAFTTQGPSLYEILNRERQL